MTKLAQFRDPGLMTDGSVVGFYEREFYVFSNFSSFQVEWRLTRWPTSEHAYQATQFMRSAPWVAANIAKATSAHDAFKYAMEHQNLAPSNWDAVKVDVKVDVMEEICGMKLAQHPYIERKLRQTGDLLMVEDSPYDAFWGIGPNRDGHNELGKIWMRLRSGLKT